MVLNLKISTGCLNSRSHGGENTSGFTVEDKTSQIAVVDCVVVVFASHSSVVSCGLAVLICQNVGLQDTDTSNLIKTIASVQLTAGSANIPRQDIGVHRRDQFIVLRRRKYADPPVLGGIAGVKSCSRSEQTINDSLCVVGVTVADVYLETTRLASHHRSFGVSDNAHPAIREQAHAYRREMEKIIAIYMRQAIKSDRTTVYNAIKDSGNPKLAEYIRRM